MEDGVGVGRQRVERRVGVGVMSHPNNRDAARQEGVDLSSEAAAIDTTVSVLHA